MESEDKILELFSLRVQQGVQQIQKTVADAAAQQRQESALAMQQLELRVTSQVIQVREEQRRELTEVKDDIKQIQASQAETSERLGQIEVRLDEGDKKFQHHESRISALEEESGKQGKGVAALAGAAAAAGGGVTAAVMSFLK